MLVGLIMIIGMIPTLVLVRYNRLDLFAIKVCAEFLLLLIIYATGNRIDESSVWAFLFIGWLLVFAARNGWGRDKRDYGKRTST